MQDTMRVRKGAFGSTWFWWVIERLKRALMSPTPTPGGDAPIKLHLGNDRGLTLGPRRSADPLGRSIWKD